MTKSNIFSLRTPMFVLILIAFAFTSCKKEEKQALKEIAGTWNIESYSVNNIITEDITIQGTWTFNNCSKKDNRKERCLGKFDYTLVYTGGEAEVYDQNFNYCVTKVSKSDLVSMVIANQDFNAEVSENSLSLTTVSGDNTIVYSFSR